MALTAQNPAPQAGSGVYGSVPGRIGLPTSIYDQLKEAVPNYAALTNKASGVIGSEMAGQLSPEAMNLIQNKAASNGVATGTPGSEFQKNNMLANLGLTAEQLQQHGLTDYNQFANTTGNQQIAPELQTEIATQNAIDAAAPNPAAAQTYSQQLFDKYLNMNNQPGHFQQPGLDNSSGVWDYLQYA